MSDVAVILPASSGPFERAVAAGMSDDLPVPFAELMDPYTTRVDLLDWLAGHCSVDLWYADWPVERKREIIAHTMGKSTTYPGERLPELKGTEIAAERYLAYVDAEILDKRAYPQVFAVGEYAVDVDPIQFSPFVARFLVKVQIEVDEDAFCIGSSAVGQGAAIGVDREPIERACKALAESKSPETAYTADFADMIPITLDDGIDLDAGHVMGSYRDRERL